MATEQKSARSWVSPSNADLNSRRTREALSAVHRRKVGATAATATARGLATNDGARAGMMRDGLRCTAGIQTKLTLLRLTFLRALNMLPPTNITFSPPTLKTHQVHLNFLPPTTKCWQPNATRTNDPPKNMSATPYISWHNRSVPSWNEASLGPKTKPLSCQKGTKSTSNAVDCSDDCSKGALAWSLGQKVVLSFNQLA